ncbi:outer membrane protein [Methylocystis sp. JAN1]|uniref:outer membrane protein n=1 Tax=Methylocystis sp. JAN1 TaxID=3397211 RepID=UPI003FA32745
MRKLAAGIASAIAIAGAAAAADLPKRDQEPAFAPPVPPPSPIWTGFHAGMKMGYGFNASRQHIDSLRFEDGMPTPLSEIWSYPGPAWAGFQGGGEVGYDYQWGRFVVGVETDIIGTNMSGDSWGVGPVIPGKNFAWDGRTGISVPWYGTVRGRLGYLVTPAILVYATGGLAYGGVKHHQYFADSDADIGMADRNSTNIGYTAGVGAEWMFMRNWSLKGEYRYTDLGSGWSSPSGSGRAFNIAEITPGIAAQPAVFKSWSVPNADFHSFLLGVSFHFN